MFLLSVSLSHSPDMLMPVFQTQLYQSLLSIAFSIDSPSIFPQYGKSVFIILHALQSASNMSSIVYKLSAKSYKNGSHLNMSSYLIYQKIADMVYNFFEISSLKDITGYKNLYFLRRKNKWQQKEEFSTKYLRETA